MITIGSSGSCARRNRLAYRSDCSHANGSTRSPLRPINKPTPQWENEGRLYCSPRQSTDGRMKPVATNRSTTNSARAMASRGLTTRMPE